MPDSLVEALDEAVGAATHLTKSDKAAVAAVRLVIDQWEKSAAEAEASAGDRSKLIYAGPHVMSMLSALGLNPKARTEMKLEADKVTGKVAALKAARSAA